MPHPRFLLWPFRGDGLVGVPSSCTQRDDKNTTRLSLLKQLSSPHLPHIASFHPQESDYAVRWALENIFRSGNDFWLMLLFLLLDSTDCRLSLSLLLLPSVICFLSSQRQQLTRQITHSWPT